MPFTTLTVDPLKKILYNKTVTIIYFFTFAPYSLLNFHFMNLYMAATYIHTCALDALLSYT